MIIIFYISLMLLSFYSYTIYTHSPVSGDTAVGQTWSLIYLALAFAGAVITMFAMMFIKSRFSWISEQLSLRVLLVFLFSVFFLVTVFFAGMFSIEWYSDSSYPYFLRLIAKSGGYFWISLVCFVPLYYLIKGSIPPPGWIQKLFYFDFAFCSIFCISLLFGWMKERKAFEMNKAFESQSTEDEYHQKIIDEISNYRLDQNITGLMSHSFVYRSEDLHKLAVQKIKERPDWENEILEVLKNRKSFTESYYFLSGNSLEHPELFKQALHQSIGYLIVDVGEYLRTSNNIQEWILDHFHIDLMLQSIDFHFRENKSEFIPAIKQLEEVINLNLPKDSKIVKLNALKSIEKWIR